MTLTLGFNIASLKAQKQLTEGHDRLSQVFERLSSGQRINRASDDAAGLAIADGLRADTRVLNQGVRNINDGISLLNIVDSALESLSSITSRIEELAFQASNGVYNAEQRAALDAEAQALSKEFTRIIISTEFNDKKLLTGETSSISIQAGIGEHATISTSVGGAIGDGTLRDEKLIAVVNNPTDLATGDFNNDGNIDIITDAADRFQVFLGDGQGGFSVDIYNHGAGSSVGIDVGDLNNDGILDFVGADLGSDSLYTYIGNGDGTFTLQQTMALVNVEDLALGDFDGDGILDYASTQDGVNALRIAYGDGNGGFTDAISVDLGVNGSSKDIEIGDFNGDGIDDIATPSPNSHTVKVILNEGRGSYSLSAYDIGGSTFAFGIVSADFNGDGVLDLATANSDATNASSILIGNGDGTFQAVQTVATPYSLGITAADINGDGNVDLINTANNRTFVHFGNGDGTFASYQSYTSDADGRDIAAADFNNDGVLDVAYVNGGSGDALNIRLTNTTEGVNPLLPISLESTIDAKDAIHILQRKREQLAAQRGEIGAHMARLSVAANVLQRQSEAYAIAESQIRDADIAQESAKLVRLQILQQATAAILAQANQQPQIALQLLKSE